MFTIRKYFFFICLFCLTSADAYASIITEDTNWTGVIDIVEDLFVPAGVTLTISPGTVVNVQPSENTRIDPEFLSHQTEILVRGTLIIKGHTDNLVRFALNGDVDVERWAGIIVDGGRAIIENTSIAEAETGLHLIDGSAVLSRVTVSGNRYGLIAQGQGAVIELKNSVVRANDYGVLAFNGGEVITADSVINDNVKRDNFAAKAQHVKVTPVVYELPERALSQTYSNETLVGNTTWRGRIRVQGQVRVPPEGRLLIMPGTVVEFTFKDTNGDGIGENGILVQGGFVAKGTSEKPIIFRAAEKDAKRGAWDSINILGSDQTKNLIEFCQIEQGYRGMHFHFANVAVTNSVMRHNYRGMQFQESLVEIRDNHFYRNTSAIQARDSEVVFRNNTIYENFNGANLFRMNVVAQNNVFANNQGDGLRIREGAATVENNSMSGNRYGLLVADALFGKFNSNLMSANLEFGLALRNTESIDIRHNAIVNNGLHGLIVRDSRGEIQGNMITGNGERGIGVLSFTGSIRGNVITANGLYGIGLETAETIDAVGNWWGDSDLEKKIYDQADDAALGKVLLEPVLQTPIEFVWPVALVPTDISWYGTVRVLDRVTVPLDVTLSVMAGSVVEFGDSVGMDVYGAIQGKGLVDKRISFTSIAKKGANDWDEISLDRALGSFFENCDFSYATWGVHSHYTNLIVNQCQFVSNDGGMRFRSGPVTIKNSVFQKNRIGMRAYLAFGDISHNIVTNNEMGIYIREKGDGLTISQNNIYANDRYNMRLGDFNKSDVDARNNWWGGISVLDTVFDRNREPYIGNVLFDPVLEQPITLDWTPIQ
nr:right-handed parallel beta-helix repeat-containing protein [Desulfobulbaceae bacterium]